MLKYLVKISTDKSILKKYLKKEKKNFTFDFTKLSPKSKAKAIDTSLSENFENKKDDEMVSVKFFVENEVPVKLIEKMIDENPDGNFSIEYELYQNLKNSQEEKNGRKNKSTRNKN